MVASNETSTDVTLFAHRGFAGVAPENTRAAAQIAGCLGADVIECDVVATADGTPVVFHDRRLDSYGASRGITDATCAVDERPTETVTGANVLGTSQQIPELSAFVDAVPDEIGLNIELKHPDTVSIEGAPTTRHIATSGAPSSAGCWIRSTRIRTPSSSRRFPHRRSTPFDRRPQMPGSRRSRGTSIRRSRWPTHSTPR